jgi:hypothetical protein
MWFDADQWLADGFLFVGRRHISREELRWSADEDPFSSFQNTHDASTPMISQLANIPATLPLPFSFFRWTCSLSPSFTNHASIGEKRL